MKSLSREQLRAIDRQAEADYGIPGIVLMENAGRGCAELLSSLGISAPGPVCICCGKGNNGGDGFVMARHLEILGFPVEVLIFEDLSQGTGDAAVNYRILERSGFPLQRLSLPRDGGTLGAHFERASWIVDALLGTGARGEVRPPYSDVIQAMNAAGRPIFAVDLPSGLDCDTGEASPSCVKARVTATLVAPKLGFEAPAGRDRVGEVHVLQIGIPPMVLKRMGATGEFNTVS